MTNYNTRVSNIPEDVILDILLRLPTKMLTRFKSVCKNWKALIESTYFIKQHFNHKNNEARLLIYHYKSDIQTCVFTLYLNTTFSRYMEPNHLQFRNIVSVIGPINSIFCVIDENLIGEGGGITLWNPSLREFRPIPAANLSFSLNFFTFPNVFGFGQNPLNEDYKVVWIRKFRDPRMIHPRMVTLVSLYSLNDDSWRHFKDTDFGIVIRNLSESKCNTYVNGFYYWLADDVNGNYYILGFDMGNERFVELEVPKCVTSLYVNLCLFHDDVAILSLDVQEVGKSIDLWVRKEEGHWVKQLGVGPFSFWDFSWPFGLWENGSFVMETSFSDLILLNPYTRQVWNLNARSEYGYTRIYSYKESLVSIKRRN
ncbi:hypothetical protein CDL12_11024 [Handroanthus impetiginosus]|uniref:F-box domain-containing protein n=1 Tax=Handroanthus impetiginosus TaxID=429701 RepID=A0A2G9HGC2_9LAMI|nr:hypothetical protein CDL12_11024 [Handroanthus impetiginosus]